MDKQLTGEELSQAHQDLFGAPCAMTQCGECDEVIPLHFAVVSVFQITPHITEQDHFCSDSCAVKHWARRTGNGQ